LLGKALGPVDQDGKGWSMFWYMYICFCFMFLIFIFCRMFKV
jgi:hypothetical protein